MKALHGVTLSDVVENRLPAIRDAMASVMIGGFGSRVECEAALRRIPEDQHEAFLAERHDMKRSSMNDIGARAASLVKAIDEKCERLTKAGAKAS